MKDRVMDEVKRIFKPEFLNRIDEIIVFHPLNKDNMKEIVSIMLSVINKRAMQQMGIELDVDESGKEYLIRAMMRNTEPVRCAAPSRVCWRTVWQKRS